jgi:hypothetical protein
MPDKNPEANENSDAFDAPQSDWFMAGYQKDINASVSIGNSPQRPYALYESQMQSVRSGWRSFDDLKKILPEGKENELHADEFGDHYRLKPRHTGATAIQGGKLMREVEYVRRYVALTQQTARAMSDTGRETDFWNGFTWMLRGIKPELDMMVASAPASAPGRETAWEEANPVDSARAMATEQSRVAAVMAATPSPVHSEVESPGEPRVTDRRSDAKK